MCTLNRVGPALAALDGVHAITDVTGFGLFGHLGEMMRASETSGRDRDRRARTDGGSPVVHRARVRARGREAQTGRAYGEGVRIEDEVWRTIGCDPQTSGGLLVAASPAARGAVERALAEARFRRSRATDRGRQGGGRADDRRRVSGAAL